VRVEAALRRRDGGAFRKDGLVEYLRERSGGEFESHLVPARQPGTGRWRHLVRVVSGLERFLERVRARRVLFFYPEFPFLQPVEWSKLPALAFALGRLGRLMARRGLTAVLDVEDLPGPQHATLEGATHPAGEWTLAVAERALAGFAAEVWVPSLSLAERWCAAAGMASDQIVASHEDPGQHPYSLQPAAYSLSAGGARAAAVRIVPTGSLGETPAVPRPRGGCRLLYAGTLARRQERGLSWLVECFLAAAAPDARLVLAGEGGEWLSECAGGRVELAGPLDDSACRALAAGCDWGLVPYPERGYFHEVFPAKLALYTSCGLPVLTTALRESSAAVRAEGVGRVVAAANWAEFLGVATRARGRPSRVGAPWLWKRILG
jgi:glycosyltransferase involved in cell wall biosynthesis